MLTGEAEPVYKRAGDMLFSGSYVLSGRCRAMAVRVGAESYAAKIVNDSKKLGKVHSKLLDSMNRIIFEKMHLLLHKKRCSAAQHPHRRL